jgi:hypothetical protein
MASAPPPGGYVTTKVMGLLGNAPCAMALGATALIASAANVVKAWRRVV